MSTHTERNICPLIKPLLVNKQLIAMTAGNFFYEAMNNKKKYELKRPFNHDFEPVSVSNLIQKSICNLL